MIICEHRIPINKPCNYCDSRSRDMEPTGAGTFYLGTHKVNWLWQVNFPLFVSYKQLSERSIIGLRPASCLWALDSGAFSEIKDYGEWSISPEEYISNVRTYINRIGKPDFIAPMDWMCEPFMVARTGLSVAEHQYRTVENYLQITKLAPDLPVIPVLQGYSITEYIHCISLYQSAGIDLNLCPRVGLGSVCRRQASNEIQEIVDTLSGFGFRLHGFGVKTKGLNRYGSKLYSSDSMAWSYKARRRPPLPECTGHKNCANCLRYARNWRNIIVEILREGQNNGQADNRCSNRNLHRSNSTSELASSSIRYYSYRFRS